MNAGSGFLFVLDMAAVFFLMQCVGCIILRYSYTKYRWWDLIL